MKPKPDPVRVLAKQLFGARMRVYKRLGWPTKPYESITEDAIVAWDAVAREAIKRLKGGEK